MSDLKEQQQFFMRWAITLGEKGRITAPPNPWVGCVIVFDGEIVGEGYHRSAGSAHAEIIALEAAGKKAKGATVYVSLEPCCHHGMTPPCVDALIESGIARVVIPFIDPDTHVSGKGVEKLKAAGIAVTVGVCAEEAKLCLRPYLTHRRTGLPFCLLKAASSLDGRVAAKDRSSKWITEEEARADVHLLRAQSQAILIGVGTAITDQPELTVRAIEVDKQPLRVLVDALGKVPATGPLFDPLKAKTLIFTSSQCDKNRMQQWQETGAEVEIVSCEKSHLNLKEVLASLGRRAVLQVMVEGGSTLHSSFIQQKMANHLTLYVGSCILGAEALPLFSGISSPMISDAVRPCLETVRRFGPDVRLDYCLD